MPRTEASHPTSSHRKRPMEPVVTSVDPADPVELGPPPPGPPVPGDPVRGGFRGRAHGARCDKLVLGLAGILGFLVTWQLIPTLGIVDPRFFPTATDTLAQSRSRTLRDLEFWRNVGRTHDRVGDRPGHRDGARHRPRHVIGLVPFLRRATHTTVEFLRPIPSVALIPLAILMFGIQLQAALIIIVFASFWQVFVQVLYGVADVDAVARDTARSFGLSRGSRIVQPRLPDRAAVPHDGPAPGGDGRADPRRHGRDVHRQPGTRPRRSSSRSPPATTCGLCARDRDRAARTAHQPRLPRHRAPLALVAPVGARGGGPVTLYTSTVVTPRRPSRVWAKFGENTAYALGLPILLLVIWGIWSSVVARSRSSPARSSSSRRSSTPGSGRRS